MHYLERYAAPTEQLRRVLQRNIVASCRHHGQNPSDFSAMRDEIVARCVASGLIDDARFAEARAATLRRRGQSGRAVAAKLSAKGVERELVSRIVEGSDAAEIDAARIAAKRKRIGPWRRQNQEFDRQKELAALARAGFSMTVARAVIDADEDGSGQGG